MCRVEDLNNGRVLYGVQICTRDHSVQTQDDTTYQSGASSAESYMNERRENKGIMFDSCW